jgi:long-chain acyl-CoA synthetase
MDSVLERPGLTERLDAAALTGMTTAVWAEVQPDKPAVIDPDGRVTTFGALNAQANRIARLLRGAGLAAGDSVAVICSNRHEFVEVLAGTLRAGLRHTPINWHLAAEEIAYILRDCEAKAVFCEARITAGVEAVADGLDLAVKIAIGGDIPGFQLYETTLAGLDGSDIPDPSLGNSMLYTSGTTGRPKGVFRPNPVVVPQAMYKMRGYDETAVQLCAGPAYHAAPLAFDVRAAMGAAPWTM